MGTKLKMLFPKKKKKKSKYYQEYDEIKRSLQIELSSSSDNEAVIVMTLLDPKTGDVAKEISPVVIRNGDTLTFEGITWIMRRDYHYYSAYNTEGR